MLPALTSAIWARTTSTTAEVAKNAIPPIRPPNSMPRSRQPQQPVRTQNIGPRPFFGAGAPDGGGGSPGPPPMWGAGTPGIGGAECRGGGGRDGRGGTGGGGGAAIGGGGGGEGRGGGGAGVGRGGSGRGAAGATRGAEPTIVAPGLLWTIVAPPSSPPMSSTVKDMPPKRTSWPALRLPSATRWPSMKVPLALAWSTTCHSSPRRSIRACLRETEPSATTTSAEGSRPTITTS